MSIDNVIQSVKHLDFVNKLDNLMYDSLYSPDGYTSLTSYDAVKNFRVYLDKFYNKVMNLERECGVNFPDSIINEKKDIFLNVLYRHFSQEVIVWAQDVYQTLMKNCIFSASINKNNQYYLNTLFDRGLHAISWIVKLKNIDEKDKNKLIEKFKNDFHSALNDNDFDYLPKKMIKETDKKLFLKLRSLILDNQNEFISLNLSSFMDKLTTKDITLLKKYQSDLLTFKKVILVDEIRLVNSAIEMLKLNSDEDKYDFLSLINDDFNVFYSSNGKIEEQDKINILKKRMSLYKDSSKDNSEYYKKLINF